MTDGMIECGEAVGTAACVIEVDTIGGHRGPHWDGADLWWARSTLAPAHLVDIVNPGAIERALRAAVVELGALTGAQRTYAEVAYRLARQLDSQSDEDGATGLAGVARELRAAVAEIYRGVKVERASDQLVAGLGQPDGG